MANDRLLHVMAQNLLAVICEQSELATQKRKRASSPSSCPPAPTCLTLRRPARGRAFRRATCGRRRIRVRRRCDARSNRVARHCRSAWSKPRSACADGRAMLTIVASRATISCASAMTTSASQRRSGGAPTPRGIRSVLGAYDLRISVLLPGPEPMRRFCLRLFLPTRPNRRKPKRRYFLHIL